MRAVREDVEKEWVAKYDEEVRKREEKERWAEVLVKELDKEKKVWGTFLSCLFLPLLTEPRFSRGRNWRMNVEPSQPSSPNSILWAWG